MFKEIKAEQWMNKKKMEEKSEIIKSAVKWKPRNKKGCLDEEYLNLIEKKKNRKN